MHGLQQANAFISQLQNKRWKNAFDFIQLDARYGDKYEPVKMGVMWAKQSILCHNGSQTTYSPVKMCLMQMIWEKMHKSEVP